jgi:hypothetical protein
MFRISSLVHFGPPPAPAYLFPLDVYEGKLAYACTASISWRSLFGSILTTGAAPFSVSRSICAGGHGSRYSRFLMRLWRYRSKRPRSAVSPGNEQDLRLWRLASALPSALISLLTHLSSQMYKLDSSKSSWCQLVLFFSFPASIQIKSCRSSRPTLSPDRNLFPGRV